MINLIITAVVITIVIYSIHSIYITNKVYNRDKEKLKRITNGD